jgi:hypothetical protein
MGRRARRNLILIGSLMLAALALAALFGWIVFGGGKHEGPGEIAGRGVPPEVIADVSERRQRAARLVDAGPKQILFGDLHVHTTFSLDAFFRSLPMLGGEGAHPPADACDFARYCSRLDFFSFNDHAEALTPTHWQETLESVRQCNALAGDPAHPDLVVFAGFEWTQVGATAASHYGHKNVIFREPDPDKLPKRPIAAPGMLRQALRGGNTPAADRRFWSFPIVDFARRQRYLDVAEFQRELKVVPDCEPGIDTRELPADCFEEAATPRELFEKLAQWGLDSIVIPHGTTWGLYTPAGYVWDKQVARAEHDPERQTLVEVYSGHGSSEEYRAWRALGAGGECPEPTPGYEPCCWRAGEIIRGRCGDASKEECERRVGDARKAFLRAGIAGHHAVPGAEIEDWKECGQCRDCFLPAYNYRPGGAAQYMLAKGDFSDPARPSHMQLGFIAASDNHSARPGTGYKQVARRKMTEAAGPESAEWRERLAGGALPEPKPEPLSTTAEELLAKHPPFAVLDFERLSSFFVTGGLTAVHASGRSRDAIWDALKRREVYGTSGPRILLWFELANAPGGAKPMGSGVSLGENPRFSVRAVGAFREKPGCPDWAETGLGRERLERLCSGECHHPDDARLRITRIEVVRIRPQQSAGERVESLIDDPWKRIECPPGDACSIEFEDPEFLAGQRDVHYYVRAIQEPTPTINADPLRCERDAEGRCIRARPCYGDYRTPASDDCLAPAEQRAWSSPIFVRLAR